VSGVWAVRALRWSFCAFIVYASAQSFVPAFAGRVDHRHGHELLVLSGVEILAALALLIPRAAFAATIALCVVFAIAAVLTAASGEVPLRFAYYAATAILLGCARSRSLWPQVVSRAGA
jgi:uncharacterized membrane protein